MSEQKQPAILNKNPTPEMEWKIFHKTKLLGWSGKVKIGVIHGWAENRRIELFKHKCEEQFGRPPTDDEIYKHMHENPKEFYIQKLARSILYNGVRVPIILTNDGTLLDGNRRYVATRWAIENTPSAKDELSNIPAWVLTEDADEHRQKVLVECNFISDWKTPWPPYIRASTVYDAHVDEGLNEEGLTKRFELTKSEVRTMLKVMDLIQEFINFNDQSDEALTRAYEYYHWFEEAHNKYRGKLDSDSDFKEQLFTWMMEKKFKNMKQVTKLGDIRDNEEAWNAICSDDADAVKTAIHIVEGEKLHSFGDTNMKIIRIIKTLHDLKEKEIVSIRAETLSELKSTLANVMKMAEAVLGADVGVKDEGEGS